MQQLSIGGPCAANPVELGFEGLRGLPAEQQVPDVGMLAEGRQGSAVHLEAFRTLAQIAPAARFVHVASEDGSFTANLDLQPALKGLVLYALDGEPLPARFGGPFRLLFPDSEDCSVNVKFLARIEFLEAPGSHTARCADQV